MEFTKKQDPHLLITGIYDASFGVYNNMLISMSPDAYVTAVAMGRTLGIFNTENGNLEELLEEVHGGNMTGTVVSRSTGGLCRPPCQANPWALSFFEF